MFNPFALAVSTTVITQLAIVCLEMFTSFLAYSCSCLYSGMAFVYFPLITAATSDGVAMLFGLLFLCNYFLLLLTKSFLKIKIITVLYSTVI